MSRMEQVLLLDPPQELHFKGPFQEVVTSHLKLTNPTEQRVCFKVKTTAPKRYCVRPNSGLIEPKQNVVVAVMLQPFEYDPNEKNKHKFMVQTVFAPDGDINQEMLWKEVSSDNLMDSKLKCVFIMPNDNASSANQPNASSQNNLDYHGHSKEEKSPINKAATTEASPPKASPKASSTDPEIKKCLEENKRLKEEMSHLMQENANLKEQTLRQRIARTNLEMSENVTSKAAKDLATTTNSPQPYMLLLILVVMSFFFGCIISKMI